jgi:SAM-dependent methyltransferase
MTQSRLLAGISAVSFSTLLLELAATRLFSVILFYHFAFLAISVALLGLGAGGVFAHLRRERLARRGTRSLAARLCAMNAVAIVAVLEVVLHLPISLDVSRANFLKLTVLYLVTAIPFFLTGLLFSVVYARESGHIGQLYGADLGGGALACLAVVPILNLAGGPNAILIVALGMAVASVVWAEERTARMVGASLATLLVALTAANYSGKLIDVVYAKGLRRDPSWVEFARWNAISRVEVDQIEDAKYVVIDADATTAIMNLDPHVPRGSPEWNQLMSAAPAVVNALRPEGSYAIIGPGGGVDVLRAVAGGSKNVTAIEINPLIANTVMRKRYAGYAYHLYQIPEVHLHVADGRSWIRNSNEKYDVIQMTLVDTWASTAAGAFALSENNLYTVEAFQEYFDHLKPDGILAITRWEFAEPREALRVVTQEIMALREVGVGKPAGHFVVLSDGEPTTDGRPMVVLAKREPFTVSETDAVLQALHQNPNLWALYLPHYFDVSPKGTPQQQATGQELLRSSLSPCILVDDKGTLVACSDDQRAKIGALSRRALHIAFHRPFVYAIDPQTWPPDSQRPFDAAFRDFIQEYPYNISPVTDDAPFFFFTMKTSTVLRNIVAGTGRGMDWKNNLGVVVLGMLLVISFVAVLAFLILPLALQPGARGPGEWPLRYFVAVGLGYILVEIAFIQRFVLFLGHPTYALTVVVFLLLLSSGAGSLTARRWLQDPRRVRWVLAAITAALTALVFLLPWILGAWIGLPFPAKLAVSALLLIPVGFAMGMPFPTGLRQLAERGQGGVEWAWAMNAGASVLGSALAMAIAIHFGIAATLASGAAAYLMAAGLSRGWRPVSGARA